MKGNPRRPTAILRGRLVVSANEYRDNALGGAEIRLRGRGQKVAAGLHRWGSLTARRPVVSDYYCGGFVPPVVNYTLHRNRVYVPARALSNISPGVHLQRILHRTGRKTGACATRD